MEKKPNQYHESNRSESIMYSFTFRGTKPLRICCFDVILGQNHGTQEESYKLAWEAEPIESRQPLKDQYKGKQPTREA